MHPPMVVLVCGGRTYDDAHRVFCTLGELCPTRIVHGGATGADTIADQWAEATGVERVVYKIRRPHENGYQRNQRMLDAEQPHMVVAFPGGNGTADMVRRAKRAGIPVKEIA
jgi:predicted Rossmann-fold nucleotide-binding protein